MNIDNIDAALQDMGIVFLAYDGFLSQSLIVGFTDVLDRISETDESLSMKDSVNILTIFIELTQNMMNYSRFQKTGGQTFDGKGLVIVGIDSTTEKYYVFSRNLVDGIDKEKIAALLDNIVGMDKKELRVFYRERRKSGKGKHEKGAGIGFIEIARKCEKLTYSFDEAKEGQYYFIVKAIM